MHNASASCACSRSLGTPVAGVPQCLCHHHAPSGGTSATSGARTVLIMKRRSSRRASQALPHLARQLLIIAASQQ